MSSHSLIGRSGSLAGQNVLALLLSCLALAIFECRAAAPAGAVSVVPSPSLLTLRNASRVGAIGALITLVAVGWNFALRRQVGLQTARLSERSAELSAANARLEEEIKERRRFVAVIEATTELMGMATLDGRALYLNPAGRRLLEIPADFDITGLNTWEFYPEDVNEFFRSGPFQQCIRDGSWACETRMLTRTGREVPVSLVGLVIKGPDGTPEHIAGLAHDITARKRVEEDLRAALAAEKELHQLKSNFVSIVSHEFRSPLGAIQSSAELLKHYFDRLTPQRRSKLLDDILGATNDMARMMEDVLLLSRVESARCEFQPRPLSPAELCQRLSDEVTSTTHARCPITVRLGPLPELVLGDEALLRHIFNNLLSNAVKYSPAGTPVEFGVEQAGQEAVFTVQDQGIGIATEDQPRLFQAFQRGSNVGDTPGTGLGLVIVKRCAALHGGTVTIHSTSGAGTTAIVRLPLFVNHPVVPLPDASPARIDSGHQPLLPR
jgi:PAS domain S-box-containing protein